MAENAARAKRTLPICRTALNAFTSLGTVARTEEREKLISQILTAAFDKKDTNGKALDYVQLRLLRGVSVSANDTRFNFTLALAALCQHTSMSIDNLTQLAALAARLYCKDGKDSEFEGFPRERALGAVAVASALSLAASSRSSSQVNGSKKKERRLLTTAMARDTLRVARVPLEPSAKDWGLQACTVKVMSNILRHSQAPENLVNPIWTYCSEHPSSEFAVSMALSLLLDTEVVTAKAVQSLLPTLDGNFSLALHSVFGSFQSLLRRTPIGIKMKSEKDDEDRGRNAMEHFAIVPDVWRLAVRYVTSSRDVCPSKDINLINFWSVMVRDTIMKDATKTESREKRVFILQLLPIIVPFLKTDAEFNHVFDSRLLSFIVGIVPQVQRRMSDGTRHILAELQIACSQIVEHLSTGAKANQHGVEKKNFLRQFWIWALGGAPIIDMLEDSVRQKSLQLFSDDDMSLILRSAFDTIAHPQIDDSISSEHARTMASKVRMNVVRSLGSIIDSYPKVTHDIVRAMTMLCLFKPDESSTSKKQAKGFASVLKWDVYKPKKTDPFAGCLSTPMAFTSVPLVFKYVINRFLISKKAGNTISTTQTCFNVIKTCMQQQESKKVNASPSIEMDSKRQSLYTRIVEAVALIDDARQKHSTDNDEWTAVSEVLLEIAMLLAVELFSTSVKANSEDDDDNGVDSDDDDGDDDDAQDVGKLKELASFLEKLEDCCKLLQDEDKKSSGDGDDMDLDHDEEVDEADLIQKVAHLVCAICGREALKIHSLTGRLMSFISPFVDQRVAVVLIDAMGTYTDEVERLDDNEELEDEEEDEEGNDDDDDEEESEDEGQNDDDGMEIVKSKKANETNNADENDDDNDDEDEDEDIDEDDSNSDSDDDDSLDLTNMDVDKEDPEALKRLDQHLSMHMVLLNKEKKKKRMLQRKGKGGAWRVKRIMGLVEHTLLAIRLRIEKKHDDKSAKLSGNESYITGADDAVSLLSIMTRLFEFTLGENGGGDNGYLTAVCNVVSKQICSVNIQSLVSKLKEGIDAGEDVLVLLKTLMEEFFNVIRSSPFQFVSIAHSNVQVLNRAAGLFIDVCSDLSRVLPPSLSRTNEMSFERLLEQYSLIVSNMLGSRSDKLGEDKKSRQGDEAQMHRIKWDPAIVQSFVRRSGDVGLRLMGTVDNVFREWKELRVKKSDANNNNNNSGKNQTRIGRLVMSHRERRSGVDLILLLAQQAVVLSNELEHDNVIKAKADKKAKPTNVCRRTVTKQGLETFWHQLTEFVSAFIVDDPSNFKRDSEPVLKIARAVGLGFRAGGFKETDKQKLMSSNKLNNAMKKIPCISSGPNHNELGQRIDQLLNVDEALDNNEGSANTDAIKDVQASPKQDPTSNGKRRRNRQSRSQRKQSKRS